MHNRERRYLILAAVFLFAFCGCTKRDAGATLAIVGCTLIDGTGAPPVDNAVVLIKDGIIEAAGSRDSVGSTSGYPETDLRGAYLLPGFINAHVHSRYDEANLRLWLSSGVTTVRDMGFVDSTENVKKRDELGSDGLNARIIAGTPMITRSGGYGASYVDGEAGARAAVKKYVDAGFDFVKIAAEDNLQGRTWPMIGEAEIKAAVEEAHGRGRKVSVHVSRERGLRLAMEAGADDIAHMTIEPVPDELIRAVAEKGVIWVPTLELWKGVGEKHSLDWLGIAVRTTGLFFKAGGRIALGTDYNGYTTHFDDGFPITEARLLTSAGLSPMDVIVAGTMHAAEACGRERDLGTVRAGKIADLLAVARNPLEDIEALTEPVQVFKSGKAMLPEKPEHDGGTVAGKARSIRIPR